MKPKYTFLLSLTFLFLFSGSVYGGVIDDTFEYVFDRSEVVVLRCSRLMGGKVDYYSVNMKDKVIKDRISLGVSSTYKITDEDEVYIKGILEEEFMSIKITKHKYENHILLEHFRVNKKNLTKSGKERYECIVGDKVF